jgi:yeast amino acid transporter
MAGSENAGLVAAETANPRKSVPRAVGSIWIRLATFYLLGSLMVTITVSPEDPDLFGQSGTNASPFVIAYRNAGVPALAHMMNAIILLSVISCGSISCYAAARTTMGLAYLGMAPAVFKKADKMGRPWWGIIPTCIVGLGLGFLNVSEDGATVFGWFSSLTSLFTLFGWGCINLSHIRMRWAWALQGRSPSELPWKSWTYPYAAWFGLIMCIVLIIVQFYLAVWPLGVTPNAEDFWARYVSVPLILVLYIIGKFVWKTPKWVDLSTVDLDYGRRFYADEEPEKKSKNVVVRGLKMVFT